MRRHLYGEPGAEITVTYRDTEDELRESTLSMADRGSAAEVMPGLSGYLELEVARLEDGFGYIAFNAFMPALLEPVTDAVGQMADAPGIIIDLRGNHGGVFDVRKAIIDQFLEEPHLVWTYETRDEPIDIYATPTDTAYDGPVVVIIDVLSASSAEEFSGALQALGRAVIVGERTAGRVLVMRTVDLPNGDLMVYPFAQTITSDGTVLESHGVIPDVLVEPSREDLAEGVDMPLQTAIHVLQSSG